MNMIASYALTPLQRNMYASAALAGRPWQYVEQVAVHMPAEKLDAGAMGQAWSDLARRHPALRNAVIDGGSAKPVQQVMPPVAIQPALHDWQGRDPAQITADLRRFLAADRAAGVDAADTPAFRVTIFHTGDAQSILVWTFPHSLLDGRAFAPLLDEVYRRYAGILAGTAEEPGADGPGIDGPGIDKTGIDETGAEESGTDGPDPFEAHCRALADMSHADGEAHFAAALAGWGGSEGLLRTEAEPARKVEISHHLTEAQTGALVRLARQADVTVSAAVLAAWGTVLARFTGQGDVVFGNTRNGRHVVDGTAGAAGCFITTVPVRLQPAPALTVGAVLGRIRDEQIAVRPFEHTPLTNIRRKLGVPQGRQIFDSILMFDFGTLDAQLKALGGAWPARKVDLHEEGDMPVSVAAYMGPRLQIVLEYDPNQVPDGARLGACFARFLAALGAATPETRLGAVSMLDADETARIVALAGPSPAVTPPAATAKAAKAPDIPGASTCIDRFEQVAAHWPDHVALMQPDAENTSYGALDRAANRLAAHLVKAGIEPGDIVGICMARGAPFITAMLAVWKAGAAFVPMDPGYPPETLNIISQDSGARLVLTDASAPALAAPTRRMANLIDAATDPPADPSANPSALAREGCGADALAYVIFTSGSTGRPKGVMVTHASLAAHADAIVPLYGLTPQDRVLQFAALSFDVALEEIVPTLVSGATLALRSDAMAQSVQAFLDRTADLGITVVNLPTGFWVALTEVLCTHDAAFPPQVRLVIVGGERVPLPALKRWRERVPGVRWLNGYGPTEATITCTAHEATVLDPGDDTVPIGRPLAHAGAWVLARDGALAPLGTEGELFISGPAVAKGYINDPDKTARSFTDAVFAPDIGRVYATGDRVVWRGGALHYLGRMDRQIKLRGFRIEPGQIEAALESHDGIERAHAGVHQPPGGAPQLVAWYSAAAGAALPAPEVVKAWAAKTLPAPMRPLPVPVTDWPHTPNGKIDAARLPHPDPEAGGQEGDFETNSPLVREVGTLFAEVLQVKDVGPATSFFDAGGDSLSLLRLMPKLEQSFDIRLKPTAIYGDPTPRGVVRALQAEDPNPLVVIPIQTQGNRPPLYAVHVLGDNGSFYRPLSEVLGDAQPVFGLTVGLLSANTPTSVPDIARFYLHQIERHQPEGPLSLIAVSAGSYVTLELAQQLLKAGRDVQALILLDAEGPAGRARIGPLARVAVHLGQLMRHGWPYVVRQRAARREMRAQDAAQARLRPATGAATGAATKVPAGNIDGVEDFVAANLIAIDAYDPQPYTRRLTIYRAGDDRFDSKAAIETGLGWAPVAAAGFDLSDVPGSHLGILDPPNVRILGARIAALLASAQGN